MGVHRERTRGRPAMTRVEYVVVALAALAGIVAIVFGTVVDTSIAPVGAARMPAATGPDQIAANASSSSSSDQSSEAEGETSDEAEFESRPVDPPGDVQPRAAETNPLVDEVEAIVEQATPATASFRVATLNVLGSNHAGGGLSRAAREAALLRDRGVSLVGLQEVQRDQRSVFINNLSTMQMWPQDALGRDGYRVQIMWRTDRFDLVDSGGSSHTFNGIGSVPIPYVLLRDKKTGAQFWVIVTHNSPNGLQTQRNASAEIQIDLVNRLRASGHPVLLMGDMNEKATYFCKVATRAGMTAANGGSGAGGCQPPGGAQRIDWIFGTADSVDFSGYRQDGTTKTGGMSDHYLIYADAMLVDKAS